MDREPGVGAIEDPRQRRQAGQRRDEAEADRGVEATEHLHALDELAARREITAMDPGHELRVGLPDDGRVEVTRRDVGETHPRLPVESTKDVDLAPAEGTVAVEEDLERGAHDDAQGSLGRITVSTT